MYIISRHIYIVVVAVGLTYYYYYHHHHSPSSSSSTSSSARSHYYYYYYHHHHPHHEHHHLLRLTTITTTIIIILIIIIRIVLSLLFRQWQVSPLQAPAIVNCIWPGALLPLPTASTRTEPVVDEPMVSPGDLLPLLAEGTFP